MAGTFEEFAANYAAIMSLGFEDVELTYVHCRFLELCANEYGFKPIVMVGYAVNANTSQWYSWLVHEGRTYDIGHMVREHDRQTKALMAGQEYASQLPDYRLSDTAVGIRMDTDNFGTLLERVEAAKSPEAFVAYMNRLTANDREWSSNFYSGIAYVAQSWKEQHIAK